MGYASSVGLAGCMRKNVADSNGESGPKAGNAAMGKIFAKSDVRIWYDLDGYVV